MKWSVLAVIVLLIIVNIWQWWPEQENITSIESLKITDGVVLSLPLPDYSEHSHSTITIDPFYGEQPRELKDARPLRPIINKKTRKSADPFKDYELAGILFKNGRMNAFLLISGNSHTVVEGDIVNKTVLVERVTETSVSLRDTRNNNKRIIKIQ